MNDDTLIEALADRTHYAVADNGFALSTIRRDGADMVTFVYADGSEKTLRTGYGDHGLTMFVRADTGHPIAYAQLTSDAPYDMGIPVTSLKGMARLNLIAIPNIDELDAVGLAECAGPVDDALAMIERVRTAYSRRVGHQVAIMREDVDAPVVQVQAVTADADTDEEIDMAAALPVQRIGTYVHPARRKPVDRTSSIKGASAALTAALG